MSITPGNASSCGTPKILLSQIFRWWRRGWNNRTYQKEGKHEQAYSFPKKKPSNKPAVPKPTNQPSVASVDMDVDEARNSSAACQADQVPLDEDSDDSDDEVDKVEVLEKPAESAEAKLSQ